LKKRKERKRIIYPEIKSTTIRIKAILLEGVKNREELLIKVFNQYKQENIKITNKGKEIEEKNIKNQVNAIIKNIRTNKRGWWKEYRLIENENGIKIINKYVI